jgi:hypothetical protein
MLAILQKRETSSHRPPAAGVLVAMRSRASAHCSVAGSCTESSLKLSGRFNTRKYRALLMLSSVDDLLSASRGTLRLRLRGDHRLNQRGRAS